MTVKMNNPMGLSGLSAAIPKDRYLKPSVEGTDIKEDNLYYYIIFRNDKIKKIKSWKWNKENETRKREYVNRNKKN